MPAYTIFTKKELEKQNKSLVELHQRCCKTYLVQRSVHIQSIRKFFILYDNNIGPKNIHQFFFRPIDLFVKALVMDKLDAISDYIVN